MAYCQKSSACHEATSSSRPGSVPPWTPAAARTNAVYDLLFLHLRVGPVTSTTIATIVAAIVTYLGNRYWSFRTRQRTGVVRELIVFAVLNGIGVLIQDATVAVNYYLLQLGHNKLSGFVALNFGIALATVFRFWSYRRFVWIAPPPASTAGHAGRQPRAGQLPQTLPGIQPRKDGMACLTAAVGELKADRPGRTAGSPSPAHVIRGKGAAITQKPVPWLGRSAGPGITRGTGGDAAAASAGLAPFDRRVIWVGGVVFAVLMVLSPWYGFHRDELYFLDCARHLHASYVDQPVLTPLLAWVSLKLFGVSLPGLRLWPALAAGATVVISGLTARELGGGARRRR